MLALPHDGASQEKLQPVYETMPGWKCSTLGITRWEDLPQEARNYLDRLSNLLETPIGMVSTGPRREETVILAHPFI